MVVEAPIVFDKAKYPNTFIVADALDLIAGFEPVGDPNDDENFTPIGYAFSIGSRGDSSVGIWPVEATPTFNSWEELEAHCTEHMDKYMAYADSESMPERFFWETTVTVEVPASDIDRHVQETLATKKQIAEGLNLQPEETIYERVIKIQDRSKEGAK